MTSITNDNTGINQAVNYLEKNDKTECYNSTDGTTENNPIDGSLDIMIQFDPNEHTDILDNNQDAKLILENFYEAPVESNDSIVYSMNQFGRKISGGDGSLSKEDLCALDTNQDGNLTQEEIDATRVAVNSYINDAVGLIDAKTSSQVDWNLEANITFAQPYSSEEENLNSIKKNEQANIIFDNFYTENGTITTYSDGAVVRRSTQYSLNSLGQSVAGEDGKISVEDINALDTNADGYLSQQEINIKSAELNSTNESTSSPTADEEEAVSESNFEIDKTVTLLKMKNQSGSQDINGTFTPNPVDNELDFAMKFDVNEYTNMLDNEEETKILLDNFYNAPSEYDGVVSHGMNEFGQRIAGDDLKISKEELEALDTDQDGRLTQHEIDMAKGEMSTNADSAIHFIEQNSYDGYDENLGNEIHLSDDNINAIKEQAQPRIIFENFYSEGSSEECTMGDGNTRTITTYALNGLGRRVAGADGSISEDDLNALDLDGDGYITQNEINTNAGELIAELESGNTEINIDQTVTNLQQMELYFNGPTPAPDGLLEYSMNIEFSDYENILDNQKDIAMFLECFYNAPVLNEGGEVDYLNFGLNEFGKIIAGEDRMISKEELRAFDKDENGSISREEINTEFNELNTIIYRSVDYLENNSYDDNDHALGETLQFTSENLNNVKGLNILEAFYEESHTIEHTNGHGEKIPITYYRMNSYGKTLAGADGKLSAEELSALDSDKDGALSKVEIENKMQEIFDSNNTLIDQAVRAIDDFACILPKQDDLWGARRLPGEIKLNAGIVSAIKENEELEPLKLLLESFYKKVDTIQLVRANEDYWPDYDDPFDSSDLTKKYTFTDYAYVYELNKLGRYVAGNDGIISINEIKALDTNGDGRLSQQEIDTKRNEMEANPNVT
ncbi:MAG: hypothetical protein PVI90_19350 [Desulfobacteraceae bacterium]|jgi:hypothetical protein